MTREEAIRRIKAWNLDSDDREVLAVVIPELKESEDERMLREIKRYIKEQGDKPTGLPNGTVAVSDMIAWLEKQKEQKSALTPERLRPKFAVGDTICHPMYCDHTVRELYVRCNDPVYVCVNEEGLESHISFSEQDEWERKEQNPISFREPYNPDDYELVIEGNATILRQKERKPAEWSEEDKEALDMCIDAIPKAWKTKSGILLTKWLKDNIHPQTKQEWDEEDEEIWNHIIDCAESRFWIPFNEIDWLIAHKPQFYWKPSEEDERMRKGLIEALKTSKTVGELKFILPEPTREECIAYLERQKPFVTIPATEIVKNEPMEMPNGKSLDALADVVQTKDWKPSEEQMEMLKCTIDYYGSHTPKELVSLYEQLKKLM